MIAGGGVPQGKAAGEMGSPQYDPVYDQPAVPSPQPDVAPVDPSWLTDPSKLNVQFGSPYDASTNAANLRVKIQQSQDAQNKTNDNVFLTAMQNQYQQELARHQSLYGDIESTRQSLATPPPEMATTPIPTTGEGIAAAIASLANPHHAPQIYNQINQVSANRQAIEHANAMNAFQAAQGLKMGGLQDLLEQSHGSTAREMSLMDAINHAGQVQQQDLFTASENDKNRANALTKLQILEMDKRAKMYKDTLAARWKNGTPLNADEIATFNQQRQDLVDAGVPLAVLPDPSSFSGASNASVKNDITKDLGQQKIDETADWHSVLGQKFQTEHGDRVAQLNEKVRKDDNNIRWQANQLEEKMKMDAWRRDPNKLTAGVKQAAAQADKAIGTTTAALSGAKAALAYLDAHKPAGNDIQSLIASQDWTKQHEKIAQQVEQLQGKLNGYAQYKASISQIPATVQARVSAEEMAYRQKMKAAWPGLSPDDQKAAREAFKRQFPGKVY